MISCTEFIPAYSELFKYIDETSGREAVYKFWKDLFKPENHPLNNEELFPLSAFCTEPFVLI